MLFFAATNGDIKKALQIASPTPVTRIFINGGKQLSLNSFFFIGLVHNSGNSVILHRFSNNGEYLPDRTPTNEHSCGLTFTDFSAYTRQYNSGRSKTNIIRGYTTNGYHATVHQEAKFANFKRPSGGFFIKAYDKTVGEAPTAPTGCSIHAPPTPVAQLDKQYVVGAAVLTFNVIPFQHCEGLTLAYSAVEDG